MNILSKSFAGKQRTFGFIVGGANKWTCISSAERQFCSTRLLVRSMKSTGDVDSPPKLKSYKIHGTSTIPIDSAPSMKHEERKRTRRRMCGPGVTMNTHTNHTLQTDIPKSMGGSNEAPQPVETLLAALVGCTQATAIFVGRQLDLTIAKMEFDLEGFRDERGALSLPIEKTPDSPSRLQEISGTVRVFSSSIIPDEKFQLLQEQTEARCPVANMVFASGCQMNVKWIQELSMEKR